MEREQLTLTEMRRIQKISICFIEWLSRDTWYSMHPTDVCEFEYGIKRICQRFRKTISTLELVEAFKFQLSKFSHYSDLNSKELDKRLFQFADKVITIFEFHHATKRQKIIVPEDPIKYFAALHSEVRRDEMRVKEYYIQKFKKP